MKIGDRFYVQISKGKRSYPVLSELVYFGSVAARQSRFVVKLLANGPKGWNAGDTFRASFSQLHAEKKNEHS